MNFSNTIVKPDHLSDTQQLTPNSGNLAFRKVWLPKLMYNAVPYFYLAAGAAALLATIYINHWFWVLPHYLIFAGVCVHMGVVVYRRRHRSRDKA